MKTDPAISIKQYSHNHHARTVEWLNDPYLKQTFGLTYSVNADQHAEWLSQNPHVEFLALYGDGEYVGNIVLTHQKRHRSAWLQVYIGSAAHRGKGLGKAGMRLALDHCFIRLELNRVWLHVRQGNEIAHRLYRGLGFEEEGLEREAILDQGAFVNQIRMSLLRREYANPS